MKNTIGQFTNLAKVVRASALMLSLMILTAGCAFSSITPPPQLELRTLRPNEDFSEFHYSFEYCKKKILGICIDKEMRTEIYRQSDKETMKKLYDMNFVLKVRNIP